MPMRPSATAKPCYYLRLKPFMNSWQVLIRRVDKPQRVGKDEDTVLNHHELALYTFKSIAGRSLDVHHSIMLPNARFRWTVSSRVPIIFKYFDVIKRWGISALHCAKMANSKISPLIILQEHDNGKQRELRGYQVCVGKKTRPFNGNSLIALRKHSAE